MDRSSHTRPLDPILTGRRLNMIHLDAQHVRDPRLSRHPAHRSHKMKQLLVILSLVSYLPGQSLPMEVSGGGIGNPLTYKVSGGKSNQPFIFATSSMRASIPLKFLDGLETRSFGIGFDLAAFWIFSRLNAAGEMSIATTIPNDPTLLGVVALNQAVTYPGTGSHALDLISEVVVVPVDTAGIFKAQTTTLSTPRQFATNIPLPDGRSLIVGGGGGVILWQTALKTTEVFDPATRSFSAGPDLLQARSSHSQTRLKDGRYLLAGGVDDKNIPTAACEIYDPKTGRFSAVSSLAYKRTFHQSILMDDGRVIVIGGFADMGAILSAQKALESGVAQTEIFNPATNRWTLGGRLRYGRGAPGAQNIGNGYILIIGGVVKSSFAPDLSNTCELYNMANNQVTTARSITTRTAFMTTFRLPGNKILVAGGDAGPRDSIRAYTNKATKACIIYNAASNSWSNITSLPIATSGGDAITLRDGTLVLSGGGDNTLYWPHGNSSVYSFNPSNNRWTTIGTMVKGRNSGATIEMQAGGIVVIGGGVNNAARSTDTWEMMIR